MGIIVNIKNKVASGIKKTTMKAADGIAAASQLSEKQIAQIEQKKKEYMSGKPDMNSDDVQNLIRRELGTIGIEVYHAYLPELSTLYTPIQTISDNYDSNGRIAFFDITKWVLDVEENYIDKLVNVYHVMSQTNCNIALIFNRTMNNCNVTMAVVNNDDKQGYEPTSDTNSYIERMINAVKGNFPGATLKKYEKCGFDRGIPACFNKSNNEKCIASVTNVAAEKSEKFISQSIEKLLDGVVPKNKEQEYTLILIATPVQNIFEDQSRLSELYTKLSPYSTWQTNYTYVETDNNSSSFNAGINLGTSFGVQAGNSTANAIGQTITDSVSHSSSNTVGGGVHVGFKHIGASVSASHASTNGTAHSNAASNTNTFGSNTSGHANTNFGISFNRASNVSVTIGRNEGVTQNFTNHQIKHTLELLDMQMKRLEQCSALGMWNFASYAISEDYNTTNHVAHMYLALTQGEESYISQSAINLWNANENKEETDVLFNEIKHLQHPVFCLKEELNDDWLMYPTSVDATTAISGRELAYSLNLPRKSIAGFPVIECAEFGRNIVTYYERPDNESTVHLGKIFHMHYKEENDVNLSLNSLASHTFITGSTGAGKSNTIYNILNNIERQGINFLVVEPAKGEYKHVFGNKKNVFVYGTNPKLMPLLRLDPFSFPTDIHVHEHIDRLIEIFNVCWPMYAAMPAVLKNAVEKSYEDCGWNLAASTNEYGENMYPMFSDVARNVKSIIDASEYDSDNKGAYKGSLLTRLNSLTNGINGMIFTNDELSDRKLFDENVIVDLSRVGSAETKSLIMGMLVLKLQEYRLTSYKMNSSLNHVTVLEEAHNILKRTSTEQTTEGSNLLGKSVEMISNAIAEMRTYGEGFIIADQAPALLDMAAIRNTNTKIIMRLPDQSDRELVGKSANLNEAQITELAKLPCGAAAVYQNEWVQPVLCKVDKYYADGKTYSYFEDHHSHSEHDSMTAFKVAEMLCSGTKLSKSETPNLKELGLTPSMQVLVIKMLSNPPKEPKFTKIAPIMGALFPEVKKAVKEAFDESSDEKEWTASADSALRACLNSITISDNVLRDIIQAIVTDYLYVELGRANELQRWAEKGELR